MRNLVRVVSLLGVAAIMAGTVGVRDAHAQKQKLSDRSVKVLMEYAWAILPAKFTTPSGKVIKVDKSKREPVMVPVDVARGVIEVANNSARAQVCKLAEAQAANYQVMMRAQRHDHKWTDQQMLFVSQLHLFTVMWLTQNVRIHEEQDGKKVELTKQKNAKKQTCSDDQKVKVTREIGEYVKKTQKRIKGES